MLASLFKIAELSPAGEIGFVAVVVGKTDGATICSLVAFLLSQETKKIKKRDAGNKCFISTVVVYQIGLTIQDN